METALLGLTTRVKEIRANERRFIFGMEMAYIHRIKRKEK